MSLLERAKIATMIPHAGAMCLLDGVIAWDPASIHCVTTRIHDRDNPLRRAGGALGMASLIEVAAQAMAVHGGLIAGAAAPPSRGFLASVREVRLAAATFGKFAGPIDIYAERLMGDASGASYRFILSHDGVELLSGRATVILDASA